MCRINPKVDFAFKKLFGSEENKDILISLVITDKMNEFNKILSAFLYVNLNSKFKIKRSLKVNTKLYYILSVR